VNRMGRFATMVAAAVLVTGCASADGSAGAQEVPPRTADQVVVNDRTAGLEHYPCQRCHARIDEGDAVVPAPPPHEELRFDHMAGIERCFQCHRRDDLEELQLFSGEVIGLGESQRLCGQCHPERFDDWSHGIHGKQIGRWRGLAHRYTCADCHDPHHPAFAPMDARPAPPRPALGLVKGHRP